MNMLDTFTASKVYIRFIFNLKWDINILQIKFCLFIFYFFLKKLLILQVFAISKKVHTTKVCARAILNYGKKQIVFLDTPGLVSLNESERLHDYYIFE